MGSGDDTNIHTRLHHFQKDPILQPYAPETPEYIRVLGITVVLYTSSVYTLLHTRLSFKWSRALRNLHIVSGSCLECEKPLTL